MSCRLWAIIFQMLLAKLISSAAPRIVVCCIYFFVWMSFFAVGFCLFCFNTFSENPTGINRMGQKQPWVDDYATRPRRSPFQRLFEPEIQWKKKEVRKRTRSLLKRGKLHNLTEQFGSFLFFFFWAQVGPDLSMMVMVRRIKSVFHFSSHIFYPFLSDAKTSALLKNFYE